MIEYVFWTKEDIDAISEIEQASFSDPWSRQMLADCLHYPVYLCLVAKEGGQVCGYGVLIVLFEEAEIANLAVAPSHRGRGIGKELLQELHYFARESGATHALLEVRKSNAVAIALYESLGYTPYGERKGYYGDGEDAILMRCELWGEISSDV